MNYYYYCVMFLHEFLELFVVRDLSLFEFMRNRNGF